MVSWLDESDVPSGIQTNPKHPILLFHIAVELLPVYPIAENKALANPPV